VNKEWKNAASEKKMKKNLHYSGIFVMFRT
jgi:hypothetical protein